MLPGHFPRLRRGPAGDQRGSPRRPAVHPDSDLLLRPRRLAERPRLPAQGLCRLAGRHAFLSLLRRPAATARERARPGVSRLRTAALSADRALHHHPHHPGRGTPAAAQCSRHDGHLCLPGGLRGDRGDPRAGPAARSARGNLPRGAEHPLRRQPGLALPGWSASTPNTRAARSTSRSRKSRMPAGSAGMRFRPCPNPARSPGG